MFLELDTKRDGVDPTEEFSKSYKPTDISNVQVTSTTSTGDVDAGVLIKDDGVWTAAATQEASVKIEGVKGPINFIGFKSGTSHLDYAPDSVEIKQFGESYSYSVGTYDLKFTEAL